MKEKYWIQNSKVQEVNLLILAQKLEIERLKSRYKPPYSLNFLEYYNSSETTTSWILKEILNFHEGTKYPLLRSFIQSFLAPLGFDLEWIKNPLIAAEKERLDVRIIEENNYAIIIENKIKGAPYQPNQIARYIQKMLNHGCKIERIFVVIIPPECTNTMAYVDEMDNDIWTLPDCEDYAEVITKKEMKPRTVVIHKELIYWLLKQCFVILPENEYVLKSAIIQFADYIKLLYNSRENQSFKLKMEEFIQKKIFDEKEKLSMKNWDEVENLKKVLSQIQFSIGRKVTKEWFEMLLPEWEKYGLREDTKNDNEYAFYIEIMGVKCGCWSRADSESGMPYWGFTRNTGNDTYCKEMVDKIISKCNISESENNDKDFYKWNYTTNGVSVCREIYQSAKQLELLKENKPKDTLTH